MFPQQGIKPAPDTEGELKVEYNKLKNEFRQRVREIIILCAFILEELGHPISSIATKLAEDLPYHRAMFTKSCQKSDIEDLTRSLISALYTGAPPSGIS